MAHSKSQSVAFQGELGAFSSMAAAKFRGSKARLVPCQTFPRVFEALSSGAVGYAVIPIENTLYGSVYENYDHLLEYGFPIVRETTVRIEHNLIAAPGVQLRNVRHAYSHPVALRQCLRFFDKHPAIAPAPYYDTAGSVKMLLEEQHKDAAAIASDAAASRYGGVILKRNIEDDRTNFTRFFLLSKQAVRVRSELAGSWKTSIVVSAPNAPGALFKILACLALRELNLTKIESRPIRKKPWEYLFYLDVIGHSQQPNVSKAINNLEEISAFVKVLGTYNSLP